VLQPRIGISVASSERSRFARLHSGAVGLDPYTTAVSDVYQDVYGRASFTGKGLYDLNAFHLALDGRFPDNALLSHDLIEGEHARVGLVTDLELIDDYPGSYEAYSKRKHRWIRGDWQLLPWLFRRVPLACGSSIANPLPLVSRWKMFDNLRRSALEASVLAMLVGGWRADRAVACTVAAVVLLNAGAYFDLLVSMLRLPRRRLFRSYARTKLADFGQSHLETLACFAFLPHQTLVSVDGIVRTLVRRLVTKRNLLEWESMAQADLTAGRGSSLVRSYLVLTPVAACLILVVVRAAGHELGALPLVTAGVWMISPWIASWMDRQPSPSVAWSRSDLRLLRDLALRTWRYFLDWSQPDTHWIVPDNIDELSREVACRTSPTNVGLQLGATMAAHDFGYLTHRELAARVNQVLETLETLEVHQGHFYNWYDTRSLQPLPPRYVSSVDSGNLCASLLTVKHGCLEVLSQHIVSPHLLAGLGDHCVRARRALPRRMRTRSTLRTIALIADHLACPSRDPRSLLRALHDARSLAMALREQLARSGERSVTRRRIEEATEAQYWAAALVTRIDAALDDLRSFLAVVEPTAPADGADTPDARLLREIEEATCHVPALAEYQAHYDGLERALRNGLSSPETLTRATAEHLTRLLEQTAAARGLARDLASALQRAADRASRIAATMDFAFLFDAQRKLLRVGYNVDSRQPDTACYGLLASEARTAVFLAIAKHDIPREAWFHLGRRLTSYRSFRTLLSWTGSMFEYAMPSLFMKSHDSTLLGASLRRAVRIQQLYGHERQIPWGISEAAYSDCDETNGRRYQAFGVPGIAMKEMRPSDLVVAPYATMLALMIDPVAAVDNLRSMARRGWVGRFGFYESIDYRVTGGDRAARSRIVPLFMAHHQAMSLMALDNAAFSFAMQRRFHSEPLVLATELLLQERLPRIVPHGSEAGIRPLGLPAAHLPVLALPGRERVLPSAGSALPAS
jgi:cyclic beta-1,2-glucan synthetase